MLLRLESARAARRAYSRPVLRAHRYLLGLALLIVALPSAVLNGWIAFRLGALFGPAAGRIVVGLWLLSALSLLWSLRSRAVIQRDSDIRQPDLVEAPRLAAAWHEVAQAAGIRESAYSVRVQESDDASGSALPGRVVAVTSTALRVASTRQVGAVLAHELGHHLVAGVWRWPAVLDWYSAYVERLWVKPLLLANRWSDREMERAPESWLGPVVLMLSPVVVLGGGITASALVIGPTGTIVMLMLVCVRPFARAALDRYVEYLADRLAVDLGYGTELRSYLRVWGTERTEKNIAVTMVATHPTRDRRIRAINTRIRHRGQTTTG